MYFLVYKITNEINHKIYVGVHKTKYHNDNYMGSGKRLKAAQKKYGLENFSKEILAIFDNPDDMWAMEAAVVNEEFIKNNNTYNIRMGGLIGPPDIKDTNYYKSGGLDAHILTMVQKAVKARKAKKQERVVEYNKTPTHCDECSAPLPYNKRRNVFCNSSCAASHSNKGRVPSIEQRNKARTALLKPSVGVLKKTQRDKINEQKELVISSGIDFTQEGWREKLASVLHLKKVSSASKWLQRNMSDIYNDKCFTGYSNKVDIDGREHLILSSNIKFSQPGWSRSVSTLLGISPQSACAWVKKHMPVFHKQKCFKGKWEFSSVGRAQSSQG